MIGWLVGSVLPTNQPMRKGSKMNQIPCCPKCGESPSTYYKGIRGDEGDICDISELVEGEDCVCYECIEQIVWRSIGLPKRPRTVPCRSGKGN
jgi:hypothetical protein